MNTTIYGSIGHKYEPWSLVAAGRRGCTASEGEIVGGNVAAPDLGLEVSILSGLGAGAL